MRCEPSDLAWPEERLGEGLEALLGASGLKGRCRPVISPGNGDDSVVARRLAEAMPSSLEIESVVASYDEVEGLLVHGGPLIVRSREGEHAGFLLFLGSRGRYCRVIGPDHRIHRVKAAVIRSLLCAGLEAPIIEASESLFTSKGFSERRRRRAENALLSASLQGERIGGIWMVRSEPGSSFLGRLRRRSVPARVAAITLAHIGQFAFVVASWWLIGRGVLGGHFDQGWLRAWALMLLTLVLLRVSTVWMQGKLAIDLSELLKLRLLRGLMRLDLDTTRHLGAGRFLSWAIESAAVQDLVLEGASLALLAMIEIVLTLGILAIGAAGMAHVGAFVLWFVVVLPLAWGLYRSKGRQTEERLRLTHELTERMVGHRTRLAQQRPEDWHEGEDEVLGAYLQASSMQDRWASWMEVVGIGWQIVAVTALLPAFVMGDGSEGKMAVAVGGIILGERALVTFGRGIARLSDAMIAWKRVGPIFDAAASGPSGGPTQTGGETPSRLPEEPAAGSPVILARNLSYQGEGRMHPVLDRVDLTVSSGDRVLLEGPSGSGKSTLAALLAALRLPDGGVLLVNGMDYASRGATDWGRQVAVAPQFGENHLFSETLAFNLLMGRDWPAKEDDLCKAESLCQELGLGELLEKMPSGIHQMVGDTGWQLSHGERSRVFVARALLQDPEIVVLDESLGPLDPENRLAVMACVERHARTLVVIAHP